MLGCRTRASNPHGLWRMQIYPHGIPATATAETAL
jgi:hypothetical protein